jgi:hypothetical protein
MMTKLIEGGPELDPDTKAHLRRMIALWIGAHTDAMIQDQSEVEFYRMAAMEVQRELDELKGLESQLDDLPDLWDMALEDLIRFEGETDEGQS